ncbi:hypothetical protein L211DRAFT_225819 [Terfezia boudieri ATCC MYA-4762]|uniref:Uncharacterized protein n=1 Tax=Terfezia boudieri ATCC MYA-4762 TaxID=1051890 RepID=A0A3N4LLP8_9PEZI|nr:hypothetical protein L211DRAFT_225819 [Terfezia boudieri ATCC MYA-4762]
MIYPIYSVLSFSPHDQSCPILVFFALFSVCLYFPQLAPIICAAIWDSQLQGKFVRIVFRLIL